MAHAPGPPHRWLNDLTADLARRLAHQSVESAISGPDWISLRTSAGFAWIFARADLRLAWLSPAPLPRAWLDLLAPHRRSPFSPHLPGRTLRDVRFLADPDGRADGLELRLDGGATLRARWWPRPGAIWASGRDGHVLAQIGRMEGAELTPTVATPGPVEIDAAEHARRCEDALRAHLAARTARLLRRRTEQSLRRAERRLRSLEAERDEAASDESIRRQADLLAARLHAVRPGLEHVEVDDFEGGRVWIDLDPALAPAANLARLYKRAARAERKRAEVALRLEAAQDQVATLRSRLARLETRESEHPSLDDWLDLAQQEGLDPAPPTPVPASERGKPDPRRLPYWVYRLGKDWELRVGRSARDNDALLREHSHGRDLWLHAQGVTGSHVVVRTGGREVPARVIDRAARLAAHYSKARTSATAPVLICERRHVRKPRKAAPGEVVADRARTVFVEPGIAEDLVRETPADGGSTSR